MEDVIWSLGRGLFYQYSWLNSKMLCSRALSSLPKDYWGKQQLITHQRQALTIETSTDGIEVLRCPAHCTSFCDKQVISWALYLYACNRSEVEIITRQRIQTLGKANKELINVSYKAWDD